MTLSDLASIGGLVSGVAVLGSLIFVGLQLRQNTQAVKAAASQAHATSFQQVLASIIDNDDVARIYQLGLDNVDSLTNEERVRFFVLLSGFFRVYESARLQWRHGQLDHEHWQNVETQMIELKSQPGARSYWAARQQWNSTEFRKWFDDLPPPARLHKLHDKAPEP